MESILRKPLRKFRKKRVVARTQVICQHLHYQRTTVKGFKVQYNTMYLNCNVGKFYNSHI